MSTTTPGLSWAGPPPPAAPARSFRISSLQAAATLVVANGYDSTFSLGFLPGSPVVQLYAEDPATGFWSTSGDAVSVPPNCASVADTPSLSLPGGTYGIGSDGLPIPVIGVGA